MYKIMLKCTIRKKANTLLINIQHAIHIMTYKYLYINEHIDLHTNSYIYKIQTF